MADINTGDFSRWYRGFPSPTQNQVLPNTGNFSIWSKGSPALIQYLVTSVTYTGDYLLKSRLIKYVLNNYILKAATERVRLGSYLLGATLFKTVGASYTLVSNLFGNIGSEYYLDAYLIYLKTGSYLLSSTLFKTISDTYKFTSRLVGIVSSSFLLKATLFKHFTNSYVLRMSISELLRQLYLTYITFDVYGLLSPGVQQGGSRVISNPHILNKIYVYVKDTGLAGDTIIDINKGGVSIFAAPADRIYIHHDDLNKFVEKEVNVKLTKGDVLSVDIDGVSTNASELSVIFHLDTYTGLKPQVTNVDILDDSFLLSKEHIWITDKLKFKIRFENSMDVSITPTVSLITSDGVITPLTGGWSHTILKDDTYITTEVDIDTLGSNQLVISGATDRYGIVMSGYHYDFRLEEFYNKISFPKYTKISTISIDFVNVVARKLSFSLDGTTFSAEQDFAYTKTVDITDVSIGGNTAEGVKTLYIRFIDDIGYCTKSIETTYYYTAIGTWTGYLTRQIADVKNNAIITVTLPVDAKNIPVDHISIYQNSVLVDELKEIQKYVFTGLDITLHAVEADRQIDISAGEVILADGSYKVVSGATLTFDACVSADRFDLVVLDETGTLVIIKGTEGEVNETLPYINEMRPDEQAAVLTGKKWPELPEYLDSQIPLYAILLTCNAAENLDGTYYTVLANTTYNHIDFRPTTIMFSVELTEGTTQTIRIEIEDAAGRTSYKDIVVTQITELTVSPTSLKGYSNAGRTTVVKSGVRTTATTLYFKME